MKTRLGARQSARRGFIFCACSGSKHLFAEGLASEASMSKYSPKERGSVDIYVLNKSGFCDSLKVETTDPVIIIKTRLPI